VGHSTGSSEVFCARLQVIRAVQLVRDMLSQSRRSRAEFSHGRLPTAMLMDVDAYRCHCPPRLLLPATATTH
jgi:hypothetical protein